MQFRLTNSQRYLVVGLVGLVLWLVPGLAFTKYRCEFVNLNCIFTNCVIEKVDWLNVMRENKTVIKCTRESSCEKDAIRIM